MFSLFPVVDYNGLVCLFELGELRHRSANTALPEVVNLSEAWRFLAGPPPGNDNLMNVKTNRTELQSGSLAGNAYLPIDFPSISHLHMSGGCVLTVRELMGDFCLGLWRMPEMWWSCPLVVKPKSSVPLQGVD